MRVGEHQTKFCDKLIELSGVSEGYANAAWYTLSIKQIVDPERCAVFYNAKYLDISSDERVMITGYGGECCVKDVEIGKIYTVVENGERFRDSGGFNRLLRRFEWEPVW